MQQTSIENKKNITEQIVNAIALLDTNQQNTLLEEVNKMLRYNWLNEINNSISPNNITMEEIVAETKAARRRDASKNNFFIKEIIS